MKAIEVATDLKSYGNNHRSWANGKELLARYLELPRTLPSSRLARPLRPLQANRHRHFVGRGASRSHDGRLHRHFWEAG